MLGHSPSKHNVFLGTLTPVIEGCGNNRLQRCTSTFGGFDLRKVGTSNVSVLHGRAQSTSVMTFFSNLYLSTAELRPERCVHHTDTQGGEIYHVTAVRGDSISQASKTVCAQTMERTRPGVPPDLGDQASKIVALGSLGSVWDGPIA